MYRKFKLRGTVCVLPSEYAYVAREQLLQAMGCERGGPVSISPPFDTKWQADAYPL